MNELSFDAGRSSFKYFRGYTYKCGLETSPQPSPKERGCDLTQVLGVFNSMITGKEA